MIAIVHEPHPVLRERAEFVQPEDIDSPTLKKLISNMKEALHKERFGVAIAAPQVGAPLRLFVVAGHVFALQKEEDPKEHIYPDKVYINPRILSSSRKTALMNEGCLSVPGSKEGTMVWGNVRRAEKVKIEYTDENGRKHLAGASGLLAQVFQHEIDHLDGILYIDKADELYEDPIES